MAREKYAVSLTGGLGNQLFQLAVGLHTIGNSNLNLSLESGIGRPRLNDLNLPEIASYNLPNNVLVEKPRKSAWLVRKSLGYVLRMGVSPKSFEKIKPINISIKFLSSLLSSIYFRGYRRLIYGRGLGYCEIKKIRGRQLFIGYFQTYFWACEDHVYETLMSLKPLHQSITFKSIQSKSEEESPLIVHVRRGDYEYESDFGLIGTVYYSNSISYQMNSGNYKKIWLFSDDLQKAMEVIPKKYLDQLRLIPSELSPSESLELMRYGQGYVIANSTFSWWAAFLSYSTGTKIIAPAPWFKGIEEPRDLIPKNWLRFPAQFL